MKRRKESEEGGGDSGDLANPGVLNPDITGTELFLMTGPTRCCF